MHRWFKVSFMIVALAACKERSVTNPELRNEETLAPVLSLPAPATVLRARVEWLRRQIASLEGITSADPHAVAVRMALSQSLKVAEAELAAFMTLEASGGIRRSGEINIADYTSADSASWVQTADICTASQCSTLAFVGPRTTGGGQASFIQAINVVTHIPFLAYLKNEVTWSYKLSESGSSIPRSFEDEGVLEFWTNSLVTTIPYGDVLPIHCGVQSEGSVVATTTHYGRWPIDLAPVSFTIHKGPKYSGPSESSCATIPATAVAIDPSEIYSTVVGWETQFNANVWLANQWDESPNEPGVMWTANSGSISSSGLFIPNAPGTYKVFAASKRTPSVMDSAAVNVIAACPDPTWEQDEDGNCLESQPQEIVPIGECREYIYILYQWIPSWGWMEIDRWETCEYDW